MLRSTVFKFRPATAAATSFAAGGILRRTAPHASPSTTTTAAAFFALSAAPQLLGGAARDFSSTPMLLASKNPYKVLRIPAGASVKDIKAAHRKMSMLHHPDRGGSNEKFMEVQQAYEELKTGTWIRKDDGSGDRSSGNARWSGFRYKTATRDSASFDQVMQDLHAKNQRAAAAGGEEGSAAAGGAEGGATAAPGEEEPKAKPRFNPQDIRIQAWFRLLSAWAVVFLTLRVAFFLVFPPKVENKKRRPNAPLLDKNAKAAAAAASPRVQGSSAPAMH